MLRAFTPARRAQVAALLTLGGRDRSQCLIGNWGLPPVGPCSAEQVASFTIRAPVAGGVHSFLNSHVIRGKPVLPMTVALGHIGASVLRSYPGHHLLAVEGAKLFSGIDVERASSGDPPSAAAFAMSAVAAAA